MDVQKTIPTSEETQAVSQALDIFSLVHPYMQRYEGRDDRLARAMRWFWRWLEKRTEGSFYE